MLRLCLFFVREEIKRGTGLKQMNSWFLAGSGDDPDDSRAAGKIHQLG